MDLTNRLVFGTASVHLILSPKERQRLLDKAIESGFRAFDVGPPYGNGLGEVELGIALAGRRDQFRITTKFGIPVRLYGALSRHLFLGFRIADKFLNPFSGRAYGRRDFSVAAMERSLEGSLRRLKTDYVDALMLHAPLAPLPPDQFDELTDAAQRLKQKGLIREFGIAGDVEPAQPHLAHPGVDVIEAPLWDVERLGPDLTARKVAFAVFRHFSAYNFSQEASGETRDLSFSEFLGRAAERHPGTEFVLAASSVAGLERFAGVMG